jgi:glutathione S-transferase
MKLYYHPVSGYSRKVLLALYEKNIPFEGVVVNLFDPAEAEKYRSDINPMGKVPYLVRDDGWKIPESTIIVEYLEGAHSSGPKLISDDKDIARRQRFYDRCGDLYLMEPIATIAIQSMFVPAEKREQSRIDEANETLRRVLPLVNQDMEGKKFALGNDISLGDLSAVAALAMADWIKLSLADFPNIRKWRENIQARPSWQRIEKESEPYLKAMMGG